MTVTMCLVLVIPFVSGCSEPEEENTYKDNTFIELLSLLPATAEDRGGFTLIDYEACRQAIGISIYSSEGKKMRPQEYIDMLLNIQQEGEWGILFFAGLGSFYTGYGRYMLTPHIEGIYMGYDLTDVSAEIHNEIYYYRSPEEAGFKSDLLVAAVGNYNEKATVYALDNRDRWPSWVQDCYDYESYKYHKIHSWDNGTEQHLDSGFKPPHLDKFGRALPFAVTDNALFVAEHTESVEAMIDCSLNEVSSLADVEEYALAAHGMHELGSPVAIIADETLTNPTSESTSIDRVPLLKKFLLFGSGYGEDDRGKYMAIVLVHNSPEEARENSILIDERIKNSYSEHEPGSTNNVMNEEINKNILIKDSWSDSIYDTDIWIEGRVLLAKLYTEDGTLWWYWYARKDTLLLHES